MSGGDIKITGRNGVWESELWTDGDFIETLEQRPGLSQRTNDILAAIARLREEADSVQLEPKAD